MQEVAQEAEGGDGGVARGEVGAVSDILVIHLLQPKLGLLASSRLKGNGRFRSCTIHAKFFFPIIILYLRFGLASSS